MEKSIIHLSKKELLYEVLPSFTIAFILAESFYKFGSFSLECIAFLLSWFTLSWTIGRFRR